MQTPLCSGSVFLLFFFFCLELHYQVEIKGPQLMYCATLGPENLKQNKLTKLFECHENIAQL